MDVDWLTLGTRDVSFFSFTRFTRFLDLVALRYAKLAPQVADYAIELRQRVTNGGNVSLYELTGVFQLWDESLNSFYGARWAIEIVNKIRYRLEEVNGKKADSQDLVSALLP